MDYLPGSDEESKMLNFEILTHKARVRSAAISSPNFLYNITCKRHEQAISNKLVQLWKMKKGVTSLIG